MRYAVFAMILLWALVYGAALYGFGLTGILAGLERVAYRGNMVDYLAHWLFFVGPPVAAIVYGLARVFREYAQRHKNSKG